MYRLFSTSQQTQKLANLKTQTLHVLLQKYPFLMQQHFSGEMAYTLRGESPEAAIKAGGFMARDKALWISNTGSGDNMGSVCFSFLPEVAALFYNAVVAKSSSKKAYLYAIPLHGIFIMPGGPWRQVISPGAFPLPAGWRVRELLGEYQDPDEPALDRLRLGPLIEQGKLRESACPRFRDYMDTQKACLIKPRELPTCDDIPQEFEIVDTETSEYFQRAVQAYYQNLPRETFRFSKA